MDDTMKFATLDVALLPPDRVREAGEVLADRRRADALVDDPPASPLKLAGVGLRCVVPHIAPPHL